MEISILIFLLSNLATLVAAIYLFRKGLYLDSLIFLYIAYTAYTTHTTRCRDIDTGCFGKANEEFTVDFAVTLIAMIVLLARKPQNWKIITLFGLVNSSLTTMYLPSKGISFVSHTLWHILFAVGYTKITLM